MKLNKQEIEELNDFIFSIPCEWDKRKSCDSLYQEKYNFLVKRIHSALKKIQLIIDLGFDYDGYEESEDLKKLIDELVFYSSEAIDILKGEEQCL